MMGILFLLLVVASSTAEDGNTHYLHIIYQDQMCDCKLVEVDIFRLIWLEAKFSVIIKAVVLRKIHS